MNQHATRCEPANDNAIAQAIELLMSGALVAFPTDTVYGLGACVENLAAVARIYKVKNRPESKPLALLIGDASMARRYVQAWPLSMQKLAAAFWPGPLTIIAPRSDKVAAEVVSGGETVALRVPNHSVPRALSLGVNGGLATPSANMSGEPPPVTAAGVMQQLAGRIPLVLNGGACQVGTPSTIVSMVDDRLTIVREGALSRQQIERALAQR